MGAGCSSEQAAATTQAPAGESGKPAQPLAKQAEAPVGPPPPVESAEPVKGTAPGENAVASEGAAPEQSAAPAAGEEDLAGEAAAPSAGKKDQAARLEALSRCFEALDKDKSGTIDFREMKQYLFKTGVHTPQLAGKAQDLMAKMDLNSDNLVSLGEFTQMMDALLAEKSDEDLEVWVAEVVYTATSRGVVGFGNSLGAALAEVELTEQQVETLKKTFATADRDRSGYVELPELELMLGKSGLDMHTASEELTTLMSKLDKNGDQRISEQEFLVTLSAVRKSLKSDVHFAKLIDNLLDVAKDPQNATQKPFLAEVLLAEDF